MKGSSLTVGGKVVGTGVGDEGRGVAVAGGAGVAWGLVGCGVGLAVGAIVGVGETSWGVRGGVGVGFPIREPHPPRTTAKANPRTAVKKRKRNREDGTIYETKPPAENDA